jgi:hypothetical protein
LDSGQKKAGDDGDAKRPDREIFMQKSEGGKRKCWLREEKLEDLSANG